MSRTRLQQRRAWFQVGFFSLFLLAPPLDLFRIDLTLGHAILFGQHWTLGIEDFLAGRTGIGDATLNLFVRGFLPIFGGAGLFLIIAWRYGRLYCGWLCPHFSVVETINALMRRASGKPNLWERRTLPPPLRGPIPQGARDTALAVPRISRRSAPSDASSGGSASACVTGDRTDAWDPSPKPTASAPYWKRRYWIPTLLAVVGFDTRRAAACADCDNACDHACPMRLKPRTLKRKMFTCTECAECIAACTQVQHGDPRQSLLRWVEGAEAFPVVTGRPATTSTARSENPSTQRLSANRWKNRSEHSGIAPSPVSRNGGTPLLR
ncbi:4Fe-4S binding protein [Thiocapsa rosea]|uniref:4Fe-4S binding protein n=1 Tax=Thiocapsa rosea TaxID=69360 RepID=A0A495V911_9GAMM|nr:4Fe-4S binding protein [Thiocapsa rosea]RKT44857.1 4Fe-4S binding protein [Thiocapsa rosea]